MRSNFKNSHQCIHLEYVFVHILEAAPMAAHFYVDVTVEPHQQIRVMGYNPVIGDNAVPYER